MKTTFVAFTLALAAAATAPALAAPATASALPGSNPEAGVPVYSGDITDRPYRVLGEVEAGVRKATIFSKAASEAKIYRELWERAEKMGADAVILAGYGKSHVTALSWGKTNATGKAIKFLAPGETAPAEPAPTPQN